jgi:hypothetical protein
MKWNRRREERGERGRGDIGFILINLGKKVGRGFFEY